MLPSTTFRSMAFCSQGKRIEIGRQFTSMLEVSECIHIVSAYIFNERNIVAKGKYCEIQEYCLKEMQKFSRQRTGLPFCGWPCVQQIPWQIPSPAMIG